MGLLDTILSSFTGEGSDKTGKGSLASIAIGLITNHPSGNGLAGLVKEFQEQGLGHVVQSWVSTGQNIPISGEQIQQVLGSGTVQQLAAKAGISPEQISSALSYLLPQMVDRLTPNGQVPQDAELEQHASDIQEKSDQEEQHG